jgi:hypothetical protein
MLSSHTAGTDGPKSGTAQIPLQKPGPKYSVYVTLVLIPTSATQEREEDETPIQELFAPDYPLIGIRLEIQNRFEHLDITEIRLSDSAGTRIPWLASSTPAALNFNPKNTDLRAEIYYQRE